MLFYTIEDEVKRKFLELSDYEQALLVLETFRILTGIEWRKTIGRGKLEVDVDLAPILESLLSRKRKV
ncbi:MAG: hypothetical protein J7L14_03245 [Candidatus Diapherotrites archaeon]|nr:hypothetical protein [Candidatus Diapherotrites archaeon]